METQILADGGVDPRVEGVFLSEKIIEEGRQAMKKWEEKNPDHKIISHHINPTFDQKGNQEGTLIIESGKKELLN